MKLFAKIFLALTVFLMCASACAKAGGTLAQGLSAPSYGRKNEIRLTQKPKQVTQPKRKPAQAPARKKPKAVVFVIY